VGVRNRGLGQLININHADAEGTDRNIQFEQLEKIQALMHAPRSPPTPHSITKVPYGPKFLDFHRARVFSGISELIFELSILCVYDYYCCFRHSQSSQLWICHWDPFVRERIGPSGKRNTPRLPYCFLFFLHKRVMAITLIIHLRIAMRLLDGMRSSGRLKCRRNLCLFWTR